MKIVADDKIPYLKGLAEHLADEVVYLPGKSISNEDVRDADVLIVRTRTRCNRQLLENTQVKMIVTATIGFDHIDTDYCDFIGIKWTNCPGCNARSVCQYIRNALTLTGRMQKGKTLGIVGVGHVGSLVAKDAIRNGMNIVLCDPPRKERGETFEGREFVDLSEVATKADIITFHTPLTREGKYPTYHMADTDFFNHLANHPLLINAARGEVVDNEALIKAIDEGKVCDAVVDTWEGEPNINRELLAKAIVATPHIAGYSADGKANATKMSLMAVADFIGKPFTPTINLPESELLSVDTLRSDSDKLKQNPEAFEEFRSNYPVRRETNE